MKARAAGALTAATALVAGVLTAVVVQAGPAAAAAPVGSRYTAVTPTRVLDTRIGLGVAKTRVAPGTRITFDVSSVVPATATSVVLNLTVAGETAPGFVTAYGAGTTQPGVSNLNYVRAQTVPNLAVVTFGSSRKVTLYNAGGTVDLLADVSGYYLPASAVSTPPSGTDQGAFVGVQPKRIADTRTSTPLAARTSRSFTVPGLPVDASAVLVNITATGSRTGGYLTAYSGDSLVVPGTSTVNFPAGRTVPNAALVPLGTGNRINVYNASTGATNVLLDIQGYLVNGDPTVVGGTGILRPTRVLAARAVPARSTYTLKVAGAAGVPLTDVPAAVPLNVTVTRPTSGGYLSVSASKAAPSFSNLNFAAGQTVANFVQAPVAADGTTTFYNGSAGTVYVLADVLGYVAGATHPAPAATTSRYLADLTGVPDKDAAIMKAHGTADAASGADFVLLDVGAQSLHSPLPASGGVALALSGTPGKPVRLPYIDLVDAVKAYADAYAKAADGPVRIAVGTSNSGNFTDSSDPDNPIYPATARGTDWADQVVEPLQTQAPSGVTIVGANDIENGDPNQDGFDNSVTRAQQWEAAWFAATSTTNKTLIFNGSANGCPTTYGGTGTCNDGWTQQQFYDLARGTGANAGRVEVLPQIYYSTQAIQWANIDRAGGGGLTFVGALTQYSLDPSTFTPTAGWAALRHALGTYRTPPADLRSVDITYGSTQPAASSARDLERERGVA